MACHCNGIPTINFSFSKKRNGYLHKYGGQDLKISILKMFNLIKRKQVYPEILKPSNITSFHKNKGSKDDLNIDRGVFFVVKLRSILD